MKKTIKTLLIAALVFTMILSGTLTVFAADDNGIKVQYNGSNLDFEGAVKNVDGRIMVPFRQILQAMGAEISYDTATKTVSAVTPHNEFSFVVGQKDITITENGITTTKTMDVVPFIDKAENTTYVAVKFIGESMGYYVSWDAENKTVVIIDPETLFGSADEDFSILKKLLTSDLDVEKPYKSTGNFSMNVVASDPGAAVPVNLSATGSMSGIQQKLNAEMVMKYAFNFDQMLAGLSAEEKALAETMMKAYQNTEMKIKMNGETGETYMQSNLFSMMNPEAGENIWYKMNIYDTYDQMGIDLRAFMGLGYDEADLSEVFAAYMHVLPSADTETYKDIKMTYAFLKNLMGDEAFKTQTSGNANTYALKVNKASIVAAAAKTAISEGISREFLDEQIDSVLNGSTFSVNITIKDKAGKLTGYDFSGTVAAEGLKGSFQMSGDQKNTEGQFSFDMEKAMKIDMSYDSHISQTSLKPDISLPEDAEIVEFPATMVN